MEEDMVMESVKELISEETEEEKTR